MEQWRTYLQLAEFVIFTDQKSLTHLNDQHLNTFWQQKVFSKLLGLRYRLCTKRGWIMGLLICCPGTVIPQKFVAPFQLLHHTSAQRL
jgi:hypothetical protein